MDPRLATTVEQVLELELGYALGFVVQTLENNRAFPRSPQQSDILKGWVEDVARTQRTRSLRLGPEFDLGDISEQHDYNNRITSLDTLLSMYADTSCRDRNTRQPLYSEITLYTGQLQDGLSRLHRLEKSILTEADHLINYCEANQLPANRVLDPTTVPAEPGSFLQTIQDVNSSTFPADMQNLGPIAERGEFAKRAVAFEQRKEDYDIFGFALYMRFAQYWAMLSPN